VRRRWKRILILGVVLLSSFLYLNNTSRFSSRTVGLPTLLAHRGVNQQFDIPVESNTCLAVHLLPPRHDYLENTIRSMQAAFDRGADVVEFDIRATTDGRFAVFHDRTLECKTNGHGLTRAHTMEELKALDIGYGYTFDGGKTFPFRGKGIGLMPSMDEVFEKFPARSFLIDVKDNEPNDALLLAERLSRLPVEQHSKLMIFARDSTLAVLRERLPHDRMFSAGSIASCLLRYIAYGWTGIVPAPCHNSPLFIPINVAPWLWGWPNRFMNRMEAKGSSIIVMGRFPAGEISPGLDSPEDFVRLPGNYNGGIWTNEVDRAASALKLEKGVIHRSY